MTIEIKNYNPDIASKSLIASFDLTFRDFGLIIRDCKLFQKDDKKWFIMPNKSVKNADGTWGAPIPYVEFLSKEMYFKVQTMVLQELKKTAPSPVNTPMEYYPNGTKKEEYQTESQYGNNEQKPAFVEQELPF